MVKKLLMLFCFTFISSQSLQAEETLPTMDEENIEERLNQVRENIETLFNSWTQEELDETLKITFARESGSFFVLRSLNAFVNPDPDHYQRPFASLSIPEDSEYMNMFLGLSEVLKGSMTLDGFILIACHELGHHLGKAWKLEIVEGGLTVLKTYSVPSGEGQADYFSTAKCFKRYLKEFPESPSPQQEEPILDIVKTKCEEVYDEKSEETICIRSSMASLSAIRYLWQGLLQPGQEEGTNEPHFDTPDLTSVDQTIPLDSYPSIQCRLDTLFQGVLCDIGSQYTYSYCTRSKGYQVGIRPNCWLHSRDDFDGDVQRDLYVDSEDDNSGDPASVGSGGGGNRILERTFPYVWH